MFDKMSEPIRTQIGSWKRAKAAERESFNHGETKVAAGRSAGMVIRARGRTEKGREGDVMAGEARKVDG